VEGHKIGAVKPGTELKEALKTGDTHTLYIYKVINFLLQTIMRNEIHQTQNLSVGLLSSMALWLNTHHEIWQK
jgi:hypothetical protein